MREGHRNTTSAETVNRETSEFDPAVEIPAHLVFWPIYLLVVFPFQLSARGAQTIVRYRNAPLIYPLKALLKWTIGVIRWTWICRNPKRFGLFLRASWLLTPSRFLSAMSGESAISADPNVSRNPEHTVPDTVRKEVYARDDGECVNCGADGEDVRLDMDHIVPVSRGGDDAPANLRLLCHDCHQARHARFF